MDVNVGTNIGSTNNPNPVATQQPTEPLQNSRIKISSGTTESMSSPGGNKNKLKKSAAGQIYFSPVSRLDISMALRHMYLMLKSGLPLLEIVTVTGEQVKDARLKNAFIQLAKDIEGGKNLATAMKAFPKIFPSTLISIIEVGEQAGTLEKNLIFMANYLKREYELEKKIKGALTYPMIIFGLTMVEMLGMVFFILPKMEKLFEGFDNIPAFTIFIMNAAKFTRVNILYIAAVLIVLFILSRMFLGTKKGKQFKDMLALNFPVIKTLTQNKSLTSFSRTLCMLLEGGIPISKALTITVTTMENVFYSDALTKVKAEVKGGKTVATSLARYPKLFPSTYTKLIDIGEKSSALEENLNYLDEHYSNEVNDMVQNLTTLLEPILIVFVAAMIGLLAAVIIGPIYQLTGSISA